jgi:hypothetical protein
MSIKFSDVIKQGGGTMPLGVIDPTTGTGVVASISTIATSTDNTLWVKYGAADTEWTKQGETGATGIQGIQGGQGIQGATGADSTVAGPQGATGADSTVAGPQGIQGIQGATGAVAEAAKSEIDSNTGDKMPNMRSVRAFAGTDESRRIADFALQSNDVEPLVLTATQFDALTEYEPRLYVVVGVGRYQGSEMIFRDPWQYASADLHVSKSGNDGSGDGSYGSPYLTISHAYDQVASGGGVTVWVNEGTYAENDGNGYFLKASDTYTAPLVIQAVPNNRVVWTAASSSYILRFNGSNSNVVFKGIEFVPLSGTTTFLYANSGGGSISNFSFIECFFNDSFATPLLLDIRSDGITSDFKFLRNVITTNGQFNNQLQSMNGMVFSGNKFIGSASSSHFVEMMDDCYGEIYFCNNSIVTTGAGSTVYAIKQRPMTTLTGSGTIHINRNRIETTGRGVQVGGGISGTPFALNASRNFIRAGGQGFAANDYIDGGTIELNDIYAGIGNAGANGHTGLGLPVDGSGNTLCDNLVIRKNIVRSAGGHAFLTSYNSDGHTIEDCLFDASVGGDNACVIKGFNHILKRVKTLGGSATAFYLKGAVDVVASQIHAVQTVANGSALEISTESAQTPDDSEGCSVTDSIFQATNGRAVEIPASEVGVGNIIDNNSYLVSDSAVWGTMFGSSVASLAEVQASWLANYDVTTNDANSLDQ